jgi:flagellar basal body P-ring protein FlgI
MITGSTLLIKSSYLKSSVLYVLLSVIVMTLLCMPKEVEAARLKDIASVKGVRENILIGYGIVVGLKGTGDSSTDITGQSLSRLFGKLGLDVQNNASIKSKNAAAVIATAKLPPFARVGNKLDITVSSIGDASSLEGGVLLVTPLRAGDQNVYAARDSGTIDVVVPFNYDGNSVELLALLENINVNIDSKAKVVLNERTGTVVMGDHINITPVAVSHGDLSIEIKGAPKGTKPERVFEIKSGASVSDLIKALNTLGVQPKDLTAIFQTLKEVGALQAELEIL